MSEPAKPPTAKEGVQMAVTALKGGGNVMPGDIGGVLKQMMAGLQNNNPNGPAIPGLPPFLSKIGTLMGLPEGTMAKLGEMFTKMTDSMKGSQMVTSNNGGSVLASVRTALGVEAPAAKTDLAVKGPGVVAPFTPGEAAPDGPAAPTPPKPVIAMNMASPSGPTMSA